MNTHPGRLIRIMVAVLASVMLAGTPLAAFAQHGGGGGHGGFGGGHAGFGGGHFAGGGHSFARPGGGVAHAYGFAGGVYGGGGYHGGRFVASPHYGAWGHPGAYGGYYGGYRGWGPRWVGPGFHPHYWGGGYWHGGYWPRVYFGVGCPWFLPVLPAFYATYWWSGVPYYYVNNVYYAWNADENGYVVTDPPPVEGGSAAPQGSQGTYTAPQSGGGSWDVYIYPRNGQNDEQTASDRFECHKWAVGQTGFDPTRSTNATGNADDYRRALITCLDARGYSAR